MIQTFGMSVMLLCLATFALEAQARQAVPDKLPVKRIVLFKNGIGYFEHVGTVHGNESVAISFTSGQLNDVLKSLTVLDLTGGSITGVAYGSASPMDRQLSDLRLPVSEKTTLAEFLGALRGSKVEVRSGGAAMTGRILSVESKRRTTGEGSAEVDSVSLITESGELRTTEISPALSVRLLETGLAGKVDRFLDLASAGREADVRRMVIDTAGSGDRSLFVSYISEVPVWKATYRIVLNAKPGQSPLLQGWAIIDNVVGEDWKNVQLSLVAGAPQSFVQDLSRPYYAHRPTVAIPDDVNTTPQTYEATLTTGRAQLVGVISDLSGSVLKGATVRAVGSGGERLAEAITGDNGSYQIGSLPDGPFRLQVTAPGFATTELGGLMAEAGKQIQQDARLNIGSVAQSVQVTDGLPLGREAGTGNRLGTGRALSSPKAGSSSNTGYGAGSGGGMGRGVFRVDEARAQAEAAARSQALGDLFEYKLKDPITILKNRSALVPIAQASIAAEKVSLWNERSGVQRPQRALWITNSTGLTLDGGTVSILEEETFAGEGIFDPIRAGEKRLVSYATDLAVNASSRSGTEQERVSRVRISRGLMIQESELREKKTYTFRNEDSAQRTIIVEHPVRSGYDLRGLLHPVETTADWMRFRLSLEPKQTASLVVEEARPSQATFMLTNMTSQQVGEFVTQRSIDAATEEALRRIVTQKESIAALESQKRDRDEETGTIFDDQQRLRENIKALKGTPEEKALLQRYTQRLNEQETRLTTIQKEVSQLDARIETSQTELSKTIQKLSIDVKL